MLESRGYDYARTSLNRPVTMNSEIPPHDVYTRNLRDRERVAMSAALEATHVREWGFFIKCYAEGRFNLSNPPDPPPRRPDFVHLVAPAPPEEMERLKVGSDVFPVVPAEASGWMQGRDVWSLILIDAGCQELQRFATAQRKGKVREVGDAGLYGIPDGDCGD